jgi:Uma2 family endonuclease
MGHTREQRNGVRAVVTTQIPLEQRMILHHVSWETYQRLLQEFENSSAPRLSYDRGTLEFVTPLPEHEEYGRLFEFVLAAAEEATGTKVYSFGSTTFSRDDLQQGFEAAACFYIQNGSRVRGKDRLDLHVDPPPDLVIGIDIAHPSLPKLPIYAKIGVPEVWRYVAGAMEILLLDGQHYNQASSSRALPIVTAQALTGLVRASRGLSQAERMRLAREVCSGLTSASSYVSTDGEADDDRASN